MRIKFYFDILSGIKNGIVVEDYPNDPKGPSVLLLQKDLRGDPIHVVWGIPRNKFSPAVLITAYRPNINLWIEDFTRRKS